jgi:hypothetical protein
MRILLAGIAGGSGCLSGHRSRIWRCRWGKLESQKYLTNRPCLTRCRAVALTKPAFTFFPVSALAKTQLARQERGDETNAAKNNRASVRQAIGAVDSMEICFSCIIRPPVSSHLPFGLNGTEPPKNRSNFFLIISNSPFVA